MLRPETARSGWRRRSVREPASFNRPAAGHRRRRRPGPYQDAVVRRVRGPRRPGRRAKISPSTIWSTSSRRSASSRAIPTAPTCRRSRWSASPRRRRRWCFKKGSQQSRLRWKDDVVAWTKHVADRASLENSELVFVGYGVVAPEYNWDDYKGVDVKGKTLVMLVNDPPVPDPANPSRARSEDLWRQGDDLLRPLDLQVRNRRAAGRRRRPAHPRDRAGRLSLRRRAIEGQRAVRSRDAGQEHGPGRDRGVDHARSGPQAA